MSLDRFKRPVATADVKDAVERAAWTMREERVGCLVVTEKGRPVGLVTDRDLVLRALAAGIGPSAPVGEFTTYSPLTVNVRDDIETVSNLMRVHRVRRVPIIDDDGKAVGIVTADDLLVFLGRSLADVCEGIENRSDSTEAC
jgi:CBS domain-containing protein